MALTVSDWERHAYVNGDLLTLALIDQIELERDDVLEQSDAVKVHEDGWETNAWCLERVIEALRTAGSLDKSQMGLLAAELEGLVLRPSKSEADRRPGDPVYLRVFVGTAPFAARDAAQAR